MSYKKSKYVKLQEKVEELKKIVDELKNLLTSFDKTIFYKLSREYTHEAYEKRCEHTVNFHNDLIKAYNSTKLDELKYIIKFFDSYIMDLMYHSYVSEEQYLGCFLPNCEKIHNELLKLLNTKDKELLKQYKKTIFERYKK